VTKGELLRAIREAGRKSDLIIQPARPLRYWVGARVRAVSRALQAELERNGNTSSDWGKVRVAVGFDPSRVRNCVFDGEVTLGRFDSTTEVLPGVTFPTGLSNSRIINCIIADDALVADTRLVANCLVGHNAVLFANGVIAANPPCRFGTGDAIPVAVETGGREVGIYAEITVDVAARIAVSRKDVLLLEGYQRLLDEYLSKVAGERGFIGDGAVVRNCQTVRDAFIGPGAVVDGATLVQNVCLLSSEEEPTRVEGGAWVKNSVIQWGCHVDSMAIVQESVLCEHSGAERHGKITASIIGPNSRVGEGEVTASLVGPFVGFHHQALLIAAYWPEGKGNVAYGANIGSNHTSRLPDQEIRPGEGNFFGLGANIKFPSDFSQAPYSIIATGATTLPQKVLFPFSLINTPAARIEGISPAYNEIIPAWVLAKNMFMVKRNENKYIKRNKARRLKFDPEAFRPEIVDMMIRARQSLGTVGGKDVYTDEDIAGLGKNYLLEGNRKLAIQTYTFYIRYYALRGLLREVQKLAEKGAVMSAALLQAQSSDNRWEHERRILLDELPANDLRQNLRLLADMEQQIARDILETKRKDDFRGSRIIDDYAEAHPPSEEDSFVKQTVRLAEACRKEINRLLRRIPPSGRNQGSTAY
jgi:carbonic anhydrase/acetyltransferase-like protein (isoleucine patch superfamily)